MQPSSNWGVHCCMLQADLLDAARAGHVDKVQTLLGWKVDVNCTDEVGACAVSVRANSGTDGSTERLGMLVSCF